MKKLFAGLLLLASLTTQASLLGSIEGKGGHVYLDILDFQPMNTISLDLNVDGSDDARYRHMATYISVDDYLDLFNSDKEVSFDSDRLSYEAFGSLKNRVVIISLKSLDDSGNVAQKEIATITMSGKTASVKIQAFRRKKIFFYVGDLKQVAENTAYGLEVNRDGVGLFGDNRGWPLGKVTTLEGLEAAVSDTSSNGLKEACEAECAE
jgi:hypothetical protein